jgi:hypothetical protein
MTIGMIFKSPAARSGPSEQADPNAPLSRGEVNFLWWFIQGSIMDADVRWRLRDGWGLCERHTAAWLSVEVAFHHGYLHGPAVLYADLMQRARAAFHLPAPLAERPVALRRVARRLTPRGPCHFCGLGLGPASDGYIPDERLRVGRDRAPLRAFMEQTQPFWRGFVCGICARNSAAATAFRSR